MWPQYVSQHEFPEMPQINAWQMDSDKPANVPRGKKVKGGV